MDGGKGYFSYTHALLDRLESARARERGIGGFESLIDK